jgi:hypothetical protein
VLVSSPAVLRTNTSQSGYRSASRAPIGSAAAWIVPGVTAGLTRPPAAAVPAAACASAASRQAPSSHALTRAARRSRLRPLAADDLQNSFQSIAPKS